MSSIVNQLARLTGLVLAISPLGSAQPTLWIIGDSTVRNGTRGLQGWGDPIARHFDPAKITVANRAIGGRSSRTFLTEGRWAAILTELKAGDFVLMQFGHNDGGEMFAGTRPRASIKGNGEETRDGVVAATGKAETVHSYGWYLRQYATDALAKGATPIVLSPVPRNIWTTGKISRADRDYGLWARQAAAQAKASFIDLNAWLADASEALGQERCAGYFTEGDHTHTTPEGAAFNAATLVAGIRELDSCDLRRFLLAKAAAEQHFLFSSFRGDGDGLHLAHSSDGLHWTDLDRVFLKPGVGGGLMRDMHIMQGPDGVFRMVWTTGWKDKGIGYASSTDLLHWSAQAYLPVMEKIPGTRNCWAPETFYDEASATYLVFWASDVEGRFAATQSKERMNNRTYFVTTTDFKTFSEPKVLLDPGFDHIDATMLRSCGKHVVVFKEGDRQQAGKWGPIHAAVADSPTGPYKLLPTPLVTERAEGPTLLTTGGRTLLYADFYAQHHYGVYETTDWRKWRDVSSQCAVVDGQRHGTIFPVSGAVLTALAPELLREAPPPVLPGVTADPHLAVFGGTYYIYPTSDGTEGWMSTGFHAWSSTDLKTWRDGGVILDLPRDLKWADVRAWAPAIATANQQYYFYYSAGQSVGVAVAAGPLGPFKDPLGRPLVAKGAYQGVQSIDPMVFTDDDGSAWLYFGQGRCKVVKLHPDMISFDASGVRDVTPPGYNEGPFVFKRKGVYYLSWSEFDTRDPRYSVAYATADSPLGPFHKAAANPILKQRGVVKGAGHHSILQLPGRDEWVVAYHRFRIPGGNGYNRETCLSPLRFDGQGAILPVDVFEAVPATPP